jgi:thiol-disulfide isomerase/thioredoxin
MKYYIILLFIHFNTFSQKFPDFQLVDLKGDTLNSNDLKGRKIYVNVWDVNCGACIIETPILNDSQEFPELKDIIFLTFTPANRRKAQVFVKKYNFNLRVFPDADELLKILKVHSYPTHFYIDENGNFKEFDFRISATYKKADYGGKRPSKEVLYKLGYEQNKYILKNELLKFQ